jgi:indolepyruvate ferredoxin oxidoreductase alpha subunit
MDEADLLHLLMGNEAVARGAIEAGVPFAIGYPGTPSTEVLETLSQTVKERGMRVEWAVNEKVAFDVATGVSYGGDRCLVTMKSAGLNVALDSVVSVAYGDVVGGLVIYVADDPGAHAGMEEQDSRLFVDVTGLPMIDVADPQASKDAVVSAFDLSEKYRIPMLVRSTTRVAHGRAPVRYGQVRAPEKKAPLTRDVSKFTRASASWVKQQHRVLNERVKAMTVEAEASPFNRLSLSRGSRVGVIASGVSWSYLQDVLATHGLEVSTLLVGFANPLPLDLIGRLVHGADRVLVLEELEPFLELRVRALAHDRGSGVTIMGKMDGTLPRVGEYDYQLVEDAVGSLLGRRLSTPDPDLEAKRIEARKLAPARSLPFCAGCPHRGTYTALAQAAGELGYGRSEIVVTGDIGCTILGMYPPWSSCWTEVSMGASIGNAIGLKYSGIKTQVVAAIGDSTFFHAGIPPAINAAWRGTPVVIAVLDNGITGMTGHQPSPSTEQTETGERMKSMKIEDILTASGIRRVTVVDPYDLRASREAFKEALGDEGPSAIVLRRVCSLVARRRGALGARYRVTDTCTGCLLCIRTLSCPAMTVEEGRMEIDEAACAGCGMCAQVCPSGAIVRRG